MDTIAAQPLKAEIKTITLEGKKLTKSIFRQIEMRDCFDEKMDFIGDELFGYVKDGEHRFILCFYKGYLRKSGISPYIRLKEIEDGSTTSDIDWFLRKCKLNYYGEEERGGYRTYFEDGEREKYNELVAKVKRFISDVLENQIFI